MIDRIKGYLTVRVTFPIVTTHSGTPIPSTQHTFFYLKEHIPVQPQCEHHTLFITNVPVYPGIRSRILLKSILEPYGTIESVVIVKSLSANKNSSSLKCVREEYDNIIDENIDGSLNFFSKDIEYEWYFEGKFAYVKFSSTLEMKQALQTLVSNSCRTKEWSGCSIEIKNTKVQELQLLSCQLFEKYKATLLHTMKFSNDNKSDVKVSAIYNHVETLKLSQISQTLLKNSCNEMMKIYDDQEEKRKKQHSIKNQPDSEEFTKVSYSNELNNMEERYVLGESAETSHQRRGIKRSRKKRSISKGSDIHKDFYRFQRKEHKKKKFEELQSQFQEDLRKVAQMKEKKYFQPFK